MLLNTRVDVNIRFLAVVAGAEMRDPRSVFLDIRFHFNSIIRSEMLIFDVMFWQRN